MRFIDRLISFIFDIFVMVLAVTVLLVSFNIINYSVVDGLLNEYVFNINYNVIVIAISIVVLLAGLKITVFSSTLSSKAKKNILVDTEHGRIQIAQETIESIAKNVILNYPQVKDVQARMTKAKKGINMYMVLVVSQDTNIRDVIGKVQNDIKKQIETTTSVSVKNVDVKIKNVVVPSTKNNNSKVNTQQTVTNNNVANNLVKDNNALTEKKEEVKEGYVVKEPTDEYMKDENDVLYKVEPNPNSSNNEQ